MSTTRMGLVPVLAALVVAGCAPAARSISPPEPRPIGGDLPNMHLSRGDSVSEREEFAEPTGTITLRDALVAALTNSPELDAFSWEVRAREAETLQAGRKPNPELAAELENFAGSGDLSGFRALETTIALSQLIELGGKRGKRLEVARLERDLAAWDYEAARIDVLTETTHSFLEVLAAQEHLRLAEEVVTVADEVLASVARRVRAGAISSVEENRAKVELLTSRIDRDQAARDLATVRRQLAAAWGGTAPSFADVAGNLEDLLVPPSLAALQSRFEQNPRLARWASELDHRRAALELERAQGRADLSVGAGVRYSRDSGDAALVVEFGLPIPIHDRNRGASQAARMNLRRAEADRRAASVRIQTQIAVSHEALLAADSEVRTIRDDALPEAETAFEAAQNAYQRGAMRLTDVLDTERLLFDLKSRYFDALVRYHGAVADLERLTGESMGTVREPSGRP